MEMQMKDFTAATLTRTASGFAELGLLAQAIERVSMVAGLERTEDAATFLMLCAGNCAEAYRIAPLRDAGLIGVDGHLTAQGIAVQVWLGLHGPVKVAA